MQTVTNLDGVSLYVVDDGAPIIVREDAAYIGNPPIIAADMREGASIIHAGVTPPTDWQAGRYFYVNGEWLANPDWQEPETPPAPVPAQVTMRQARLALLSYGLLDDVDAVLAAIPDPAQRQAAIIEWEYSSAVLRTNPLITALGAGLGLTPENVDDLFRLAATL